MSTVATVSESSILNHNNVYLIDADSGGRFGTLTDDVLITPATTTTTTTSSSTPPTKPRVNLSRLAETLLSYESLRVAVVDRGGTLVPIHAFRRTYCTIYDCWPWTLRTIVLVIGPTGDGTARPHAKDYNSVTCSGGSVGSCRCGSQQRQVRQET
jgi:hypothetical protein